MPLTRAAAANALTRAEGWAVVDSDGINVSSVSPTPRGAMVNWLLTVKKIGMTHDNSDAFIEKVWKAEADGAICRQVLIIVAGKNK